MELFRFNTFSNSFHSPTSHSVCLLLLPTLLYVMATTHQRPTAEAAQLHPLENLSPTKASEVKTQFQSPLFGVIPGEIRNAIFELALEEYDDPQQLYQRTSYYARPGIRAVKRVDAQLLRTCKRVYSETRSLPLKNLETEFYLGSRQRCPPGMYSTLLYLNNQLIL